MKARVKSWDEIKETLKYDGFGYMYTDATIGFAEGMRELCGKVIDVTLGHGDICYDADCWYWHRDWLEIIDEGAEIAEIYALLLIESGEI